mmetsp:Transcript_79660/g.155902  ORF Transcript_79660/g.155902 Transcript_79660/m.155902 type:complete len:489 (+) Transcript_79660:130-1596(+)
MFKFPFGGGEDDDGGSEVHEDFGPEISMIPGDTDDLKATVDPTKNLGMGLSQSAWVEYVQFHGQASKAGIARGVRVVRVESHGAWSSCAGLGEVKLALAEVRGRGDPEARLVVSGALPGELKWNGACLGSDGCLYCVPANALEVLCIDPSADSTASTFGHLPAFDPVVGEVDDRWFGGCAVTSTANHHGVTLGVTSVTGGDKSKVYGIPFNGTQVLEIDCSGKACTLVGPALLHGARKWRGGAVCQFGRVFGVPCDAASVLSFDPKSGTAVTFGDLSADGSNKWHGGVFCGRDERIWCVPFDSDKVLAIDPELRTCSYLFDGPGQTLPESGTKSGKWAGAVVGLDECIYCIPYNASCVLKLDPHKRTAEGLGSFPPGLGKWSGGVLAPDGCIYGIPHHSAHMLRIDPKLGEAVMVGKPLPRNPSRPSQWRGGCLAPNGDVYGAPSDATAVLRLHTRDFARLLEAGALEAAEEEVAAAAAAATAENSTT